MGNPVRIYVLHHPTSERARELTDHIYDWFRLANLEGIPVYLRSAPGPHRQFPLPPAGGEGVLEYLIPLVDSRMVRDATWHDYLGGLAAKCLRPPTQAKHPTEGAMMFPVALDGSAYNLPAGVNQRNYIRFSAPSEDLEPAERARQNREAVEEMLKHLTEAMSRDLSARLFPELADQKLKIFISYARADGAEVPKKLRDYIQSQTQCAAFFDENDIGFGAKFSGVLKKNVGDLSRALIVVSGDHYAERPWCRWEIGRFMQENPRPLNGTGKGRRVLVFHPALVLDTMKGERMTRVIPELGQAPTLRWADGRERSCFSTLMREALLGARNVLAARQAAANKALPVGLVVSRMPGPMTLQRLLDQHRKKGSHRPGDALSLNYPGNGLPLMELRLLESTFANVKFTAFRDIHRRLPETMTKALIRGARPLNRKVIAISTGNAEELASLGYLPQHRDEALIYLLRPLLRLGVDLLYGGRLRMREESGEKKTSSPAKRNMTLTLIELLGDERHEAELNKKQPPSSRLYNPSAWPDCLGITPDEEAARINTCSLLRLMPEDAGLPRWVGAPLEPGRETPRQLAYEAVVLSHMRYVIAHGFPCPVPRDRSRRVQPAAFVFMGGKTNDFSGMMPGIMEEFVRAVEAEVPVFILGGFGGAGKVLADALLEKSADKTRRPEAFTTAHYLNAKNPNYSRLLKGYEKIEAKKLWKPEQAFDDLWKRIQQGRTDGLKKLLNNGLSDQENELLLKETDTLEAVHRVWEGMSRKFAAELSPPAAPKSPRRKK